MRKKLEFKVRHVNGLRLNVLTCIKGSLSICIVVMMVDFCIKEHWLLVL